MYVVRGVMQGGGWGERGVLWCRARLNHSPAPCAFVYAGIGEESLPVGVATLLPAVSGLARDTCGSSAPTSRSYNRVVHLGVLCYCAVAGVGNPGPL